MLARLLKPFIDLASSPRGLWYVIGAFVVESIAYFGILTLMTTYLGKDLHWHDAYASVAVSGFTMLVTLFMLGLGSFAEETADHLLRVVFDWRSALVGTVPGIRQRTGPSGPGCAVHGAGPGAVADGQGHDWAVFGIPLGYLLSPRHAAGPVAHGHAVADLWRDCHDLAHRSLAGAKLGPAGLGALKTNQGEGRHEPLR
jgi:hypothetical protein